MLLKDKTAVVYGAAGPIGSSVARAYAREGARVHLAGRTAATLDAVAHTIRSSGGIAHVAPLDALDKAAVAQHAQHVTDESGGIDACFNATANDDIQGRSLVDMTVEEFLQPVIKSLTAHLNITTAVSTHIARRGGGTVWSWAAGAGDPAPRWCARRMGRAGRPVSPTRADLGPQGIRIVWLLSPGSPSPSTTTAPRSYWHLVR